MVGVYCNHCINYAKKGFSISDNFAMIMDTRANYDKTNTKQPFRHYYYSELPSQQTLGTTV